MVMEALLILVTSATDCALTVTAWLAGSVAGAVYLTAAVAPAGGDAADSAPQAGEQFAPPCRPRVGVRPTAHSAAGLRSGSENAPAPFPEAGKPTLSMLRSVSVPAATAGNMDATKSAFVEWLFAQHRSALQAYFHWRLRPGCGYRASRSR
jgi:hypothetical protein